MKRILMIAVILVFASTVSASAAKARYVVDDEDSRFHAIHLESHVGEESCSATGNYAKIRSLVKRDRVIGHLEQADRFTLLEVQNEWVKIRITKAAKSSPDSSDGMTGWVDSDYIDCGCSLDEYYQKDYAETSKESVSLEDCIGTSLLVCIGNNLRVRNKPSGERIIGHLEKADEFILLSVIDGWAKIRVIRSAQSSKDSWVGLTGWVSVDYIQVKENAQLPEKPLDESWDGYSEILDYFYRGIIEEWDFDSITDRGNIGRHYFPNSLNEYGFFVRDLNRDGIEELFIMHRQSLSPENDGGISAIYTRINGYPIRILESWDRNRNYLCADGSVYSEGSNGASYSVHYIYELKHGSFVVREGVLSGDYVDQGEIKYGWFWVDEDADFTYAEHQLITDRMAKKTIDEYLSTVVRQIDGFVSFAEYGCER